MQRGAWHQCGDRSQKIVLDQLQHGSGKGVILSPRDLSAQRAVEYARRYRELGADVLIDQQFYEPTFTNGNLASYATSEYRRSISQLRRITDQQFAGLATALHGIHQEIGATAVLAPALVYETGRPDIVEVNANLFRAAKQVGDAIGVPTYATVVLGRSASSTMDTINAVLSHATSLGADGWYYAFEFEPERIPSDYGAVYRCCVAGLRLACTGRPVLNAYAGPMALLSLGFGATGAAIGHSQNLWKFTRGRWQPPSGQGGGGDAPPRFFSGSLWGTIIYPDEFAQLPGALRARVFTHSQFSAAVESRRDWPKWEANKHLINVVANAVLELAETDDPRANAQAAINRLMAAVQLHGEITRAGVSLRDQSNVYQRPWASALTDLLRNNDDDFEFLSLLS